MATSDKRSLEDVKTILNKATPADWYHVQRKLEMTREEILNDPGLLLAILAYFIVRQDEGKADFNDYFHMSEEDLTALVNVEDTEVEEAFDETPSPKVSTKTSTPKNSKAGPTQPSN